MARARRVVAVLIGVVLVMGVTGSLADAAAGRYSKVSSDLSLSGGGLRTTDAASTAEETTLTLQLGFTESGLGGAAITYSVTWPSYSVVLGCVNNGSNKVSGKPKSVSYPGSAFTSDLLTPDSQGKIVVALGTQGFSFGLPTGIGAAALSCTGSQTAHVISATVNDVVVTDTVNNSSYSYGTITKNFYSTR